MQPCKDALDALGGQVTFDTWSKLDRYTKIKVWSAFGTFRNSPAGQAIKEQYDKATEDERWELMRTFVLDGACGKAYASNTKTISHKAVARGTGRWCTQAMLAGPSFFNDSGHAKRKCEAKVMEEWYDSDAEVTWYWYEEETSLTEQKRTFGAKLQLDCDISSADYERVGQSMLSLSSGSSGSAVS